MQKRALTVVGLEVSARYGTISPASIVLGILHPAPAKPLPIDFFPKVPFLRIAKWPILDGRISTEWVIADPDGLNVHHPISLSETKPETTK